MKDALVRIQSVTIQNFKNTKYGKIAFENSHKPYTASILGLYGQNGSGKTALIDALALLKFAMTGQAVPAYFADYVHVEAECALLRYEFKVLNHNNGGQYSVFYSLKLRKDREKSEGNWTTQVVEQNSQPQERAVIFDEELSYSYGSAEGKIRRLPIVDTASDGVFGPMSKYRALVGNDTETRLNLLVAKKYAAATARSFVFSKELLDAVRKNCREAYHVFLFESLIEFGNDALFVIHTPSAGPGAVSLNALPLSFRYEEAVGSLILPLNGSALIPVAAFQVVEKVIGNMNVVLSQLVPGLTIAVKNLGTQMLQNGEMGVRIQLMSMKNAREIPLQYESEGIKKLVSVLQLLIVVYNNPSITVAIDEMDAGVFEYLLGELLKIISEKGRGQLIFTSHNLRPLETLDRGFIAFTTTNPENRYIRLGNIHPDRNLRDFYYRDIVLGEQDEPIYEPTNNYEIALAFREAGEWSGS